MTFRFIRVAGIFFATCVGFSAFSMAEEPPATPEKLVGVLREKDVAARRRAFCEVATRDRPEGAYRDVLMAGLEDADDDVRQFAAIALANMGLAEKKVLSELLRGMRTDKGFFLIPPAGSRGAMFAMARLKAAAVPALVSAINDKSLVPLIDDKMYPGRHAAIEALSLIGPDAKTALPEIVSVLKNEHDPNYAQLVFAKWRIDGDADFAVSRLSPLFKDKKHCQCGGALTFVSNMGPAAKGAVPALAAALKEHRSGELATVLQEIGPPDAVVPPLLEALRDPQVVYSASEALRNLGVPGEKIVSVLLKTFEEHQEHATAPGSIAAALKEFGPLAKRGVPLLIKTLTHPNVGNRGKAVEALGAIGPDAKAALPALTVSLDDDYVKELVPAALRRIRSE